MKKWNIVLLGYLYILVSCGSTNNEMLPAENGLDNAANSIIETE